MDWILLSIVLVLGGITSYTDIRYGLIKNIFLIVFLIVGVVYNLVMLDSNYYFLFVLNGLLCIIIGYLLWDIGLWNAGDGKLFSIYGIIIPVSLYSVKPVIPYFPSVLILINTFVPQFLILFCIVLFSSSWKEILRSLKTTFELKNISQIFLSILFFSLIAHMFASLLGFSLNFFWSMIMLGILYYITSQFNLSVLISRIIMFVLSTISLFFIPSIKEFLITFVIMFFSYLILRIVAFELAFNKLTHRVPIRKLTPGMVLADVIYNEGEKQVIRRPQLFSFISYFKENRKDHYVDIRSEGITVKDIRRIQLLQKKHPEMTHIKVHKTVPFAPYMLMGVLLTIMTAGNLFVVLFSYLL